MMTLVPPHYEGLNANDTFRIQPLPVSNSRQYSDSVTLAAEGLVALSNTTENVISNIPLSRKRKLNTLDCGGDDDSCGDGSSLSSNTKKKKVCFDDSSNLYYKSDSDSYDSQELNTQSVSHVLQELMNNSQSPLKLYHFCRQHDMLRRIKLPDGRQVLVVVPNKQMVEQLNQSIQIQYQGMISHHADKNRNDIAEKTTIQTTIISSATAINSPIATSAIINTVDTDTTDTESMDVDGDKRPVSSIATVHTVETNSQGKTSNMSVLLCQEFGRYFESHLPSHSLQCEPIAVDEAHSISMRCMLKEEEILEVATNFFGAAQADIWRRELQMVTAHSAAARAEYLLRQSSVKNPRVKVVFQLLQCSDFFYSPRGQIMARDVSLQCFVQDFGSSLLRILSPTSTNICEDAAQSDIDESTQSASGKMKKVKSKEGSVRWRIQQSLRATLPLAYFCVSHLMTEHRVPLEQNLCQFLLLVSCLEARGVYHYRASNNLSLSHKSYRYMIERVGGKDYSSKELETCERAEKELIRTFEIR